MNSIQILVNSNGNESTLTIGTRHLIGTTVTLSGGRETISADINICPVDKLRITVDGPNPRSCSLEILDIIIDGISIGAIKFKGKQYPKYDAAGYDGLDNKNTVLVNPGPEYYCPGTTFCNTHGVFELDITLPAWRFAIDPVNK
jgi:hypothetical protein